jgi:MOSC domain-containing protein YiiM
MEFERLSCDAKVVAVLRTQEGSDFVTQKAERLSLTLAGIPGDRHSGFHKAAGVREKALYGKGTPIANHRQWSAVSAEELEVIAEAMGLPHVDPGYLGANFVFSGIPDLTKLPSLSRIRIGKAPNQATLIVYEENEPCRFPQEAMEKAGVVVTGQPFVKAAYRKRGLVGWVEKGARVVPGDPVEVFIPKLR